MRNSFKKLHAATLALAVFLSGNPPQAQEIETLSELRGKIERSVAELAGDPELDAEAKTNLQSKYEEAARNLDSAAAFEKQAAAVRDLLNEGPGKLEALRRQISGLEEEEKSPAALKTDSFEEAETLLAQEEAMLAKLRSDAIRLKAELESTGATRNANRERATGIEAELVAARTTLSPLGRETRQDQAAATVLEARIEALEAEMEVLQLQLESLPLKTSLLEAEAKLNEAQIQRSTRRISELNSHLAKRNLAQAGTVQSLLERIRREPGGMSPALAESVEELERHTAALVSLGEETRRISYLRKVRQRELDVLENSSDIFRKLIELGDLEGEFAEMFLQALRKLPEKKVLDQRLAETGGRIATMRRRLFELGDTALLPDTQETEEVAAGDLAEISEKIKEVKKQLESNYARVITELEEVEKIEGKYARSASEFRGYATEKLFWVRSSPPVSGETLSAIPEGLRYCYGVENFTKLSAVLAETPLPYHLFAATVILVLVLGRRKFRKILVASGEAGRRISTDSFINTLRATAMTVLLALPLPFLALALALGIEMGNEDNDKWILGLQAGLNHVAPYLFLISMITEICHKGGLADLHFGWPEKQILKSRRIAKQSLLIYLPTVITLAIVLTEGGSLHLNGIGRVAALVLIAGLGVLLANLMHPRNGLIAAIHERDPDNTLGKTRKIWAPLIYTLTAAICALLLLGYIITSVMLIIQFGLVILVVTGALLIHALVTRLLSIQERRLALEKALAERNARREKAREEAAEKTPAGSAHGDESFAEEIQEEALDLTRVNEHTRRLLRFLVGIGLLWALYALWSGFAPVTRTVDQINLPGGLTLSDLLLTAVVITLTVSTVRNLPGLLEGFVFSRTNLTSGGRNTAITLGQYIIVGIGASFLFQNLGIDWSKLAFIAAALSVGIGFGLQEVVANFISGIILLFERPIRVGDVVTVDGVDGVVSKIRIRATTITGWDRKEFIVPNKNFVTGTLLNWTLTNAVNRIFIPVGVAYGSDTEKAREILLEIAGAHPEILKDPGPIASFTNFGDSTLSIELRAYLPDLSNRLSVISELHTSIDKAFKQAGIEIAFPQLDLHLRSKV